MHSHYLFPHRCKLVGWVLVGLATLLWSLQVLQVLELPNLMSWLPPVVYDKNGLASYPSPRENYDLYALFFIVGAVLAACSREKQEDEFISQIRLDSLLWALYAYCGLLIMAIVLVSGLAFLQVMMYAMFAPLLLFLLRFQIGLLLLPRASSHD